MTRKPPDTIASRLTRLRLAAGLSQSALARKAGIRRATLTDIEAGKQQPSLATAAKLVAALGVSLAEFDLLEVK